MKKTAQLRPAQPGYVKVVVSLSDADASAVKGRAIYLLADQSVTAFSHWPDSL